LRAGCRANGWSRRCWWRNTPIIARGTAKRRCQAQILARRGIATDRSTLAFRVGYAAAEIKPLWRLMRQELRGSTKSLSR
jgi:hypothetical protein